MDKVDNQLMDWAYNFLVFPPVDFIIYHSFIIGFIAGVISLTPFIIKRTPHILIFIIAALGLSFAGHKLELELGQLLYSAKSYFIMKMLGNYIIGCFYGLVIANLIQRIRGEHDNDTV